ncbi:MAG TPA: nucleotide pyrophosphohydrolase [Pirellulaceae bacterium]|nr:nucleotide pyrophosphohydrolase [Pirellulaceae bacterium]
MSNDTQVTLAEVRNEVATFVAERDWNRFHAPKNLAMSLAIEAAELMEHFQWIDIDASRRIGDDPAKRQAIGEEIADVVCYALALTNELGFDLATILRDKMAKNRIKYPIETIRGRWGHDAPPAEEV